MWSSIAHPERTRRAPVTVPTPEPAQPDVASDQPWHVLLFNDDVHTFEEVIRQLMKATGCTQSTAEGQAWTVHTKGKCTVFTGTFEECLSVQGILNEIALLTEIRG